jgi:hypothetical protein
MFKLYETVENTTTKEVGLIVHISEDERARYPIQVASKSGNTWYTKEGKLFTNDDRMFVSLGLEKNSQIIHYKGEIND